MLLIMIKKKRKKIHYSYNYGTGIMLFHFVEIYSARENTFSV